jgi:hypothetical protein
VTDCRAAVQRFLAKDLREWRGLPQPCPDPVVAGWFEPGEAAVGELLGEGAATLGTDLVEYRYLAVEVGAFPQPVRLYLRHGGLAVVRAELWTLGQAGGTEPVDLGEPAERVDLVWRQQVIPGAEHVYADRGLALGVLPATGAIVTAAGFAPCGVQDYQRRYAPTEPMGELLPRRPAG